MKDRLNIGCGRFPIPDYHNVDYYSAPGVDEQVDLESFPWPWPDESFSEVRAIQVLEHLWDLAATMREMARVLRPGGRVVVGVPFGIRWLYDPFHRHAFNHRTLRAFIDNNAGLQSGALFTIESETITDYEMPFRWHVKTHLPRLHAALVEKGLDGKERLKYPLGRRMELTVILRKRP